MKKILLLTLPLLFTLSCSEDLTKNELVDSPSVVLISDNVESSDIIINVMGSIRKIYKNAYIDYIKTKSFDLYEATYHLEVAAKSYPDNTYFVVIVEPGAGSGRMVCKDNSGRRYLIPDNGVASRLMLNGELSEFYSVTNSDVLEGGNYQNMSIENFYSSATVALLEDKHLSNFGEILNSPETIEISQPNKNRTTITGQILYIDNFGNCHSNVSNDLMSEFDLDDLLKIEINGEKTFFAKLGTTYSSVGNSQNVGFIDASLKLRLAVNVGDLSLRYAINAGDKIKITKSSARIGILYFNKSSVATSITEGMKEKLSELGLSETNFIQFIERDADNDASRLFDLVQEILDADVDVFLSVSTPASQAAVNNVPEKIPLVFTYVTDPKSSGILNTRGNLTGLSDATNFNDYLSFVKRIMPNLKNAGRLYNPYESNSAFAQSQLVSLMRFYNLNFTSVGIPSINAVYEGYWSLANNSNIDAILVAADNTVSDGMTELTSLAIKDKIPVIGDSFQHCEDGALASISIDYEKLASSTGERIANVLLGADPDEEEIKYFSTDVIALNTKTAADIGFTIPSEILSEAKYTYSTNN
ncbi:SAM-dependent chlorinase/fluorinase [Maribellus maritimus]|uniref:SAM-dependent chlorinase/fluorinase n=1 Tax=Maribellus maritimus TaxID=2870838 RepID=UPI001EEB71A3|nr:SAM-dependent chlorinase/fluorinase [Maribellus maritimus]MCG6189935.1 SAM-dependent chlorinase/fluorinase [Maribellus maritimus]